MIETIAETLVGYRYIGVFLLSFISNSIPFVGVPYLSFLILITPFLNFWELILIGILSALGASLGKVVIYLLGRGISYTLPEKTKENLLFFQKLLRKWGAFAIFLFAASPLPDDVLYIPLGMAQYKLIHYFIAVFCGKLVVTTYVTFFGRFTMDLLEGFTDNFEFSFIVLFMATMIFTLFVVKFDWKKVFEKFFGSK